MSEDQTKTVYRGEEAQWPHQIPLKGWIDIAKRVFHEMKADNVQIVSAGVAFYFFPCYLPHDRRGDICLHLGDRSCQN